MSRRLALCVALALVFVAGSSYAAQLTADRTDQGVVVKIDGQPFVQYWTRAGSKPVVWPIIGPTGQPMTRAYPMGKGENEREDHIHQRSLWFTHGKVNDVDFWGEPATYAKAKIKRLVGEIRHREFVDVHGGPQAVIVTRNDWLDQNGKKMLEDERRLTFGVMGGTRQIDFDIKLTASVGPVTFGDTKEGSFGIRVAETMKVDQTPVAKPGATSKNTKKPAEKAAAAKPIGGQIVNAEGLRDKDAWGKRSSWVDYHGPVAGKTVGIAVLNHPSSFRYPTYWHVRTYGLYAANPFGVSDFTGKKEDNGQYVLAKGQSICLRYRVLFHEGDERQSRIADAFAGYAKESK
jgi:hypothetical protein